MVLLSSVVKRVSVKWLLNGTGAGRDREGDGL